MSEILTNKTNTNQLLKEENIIDWYEVLKKFRQEN